ncbi:fructose-bisphosphate aldolase [Thermanaeromonas toyohensis ToBE]|uniref:Fructose-bisphosphate aldolase n=1 Tax=Thermanaeromonas toyohensis ToBE TaxID=698762 RepID=A0A1W1VVS0_9FIRM|nr:class II fructose-bisphosphate aldolase [Thermanaeromonas toyohensis]SMB97459.1 fructose-bisphosphate aldolase [Thermanaeromonas toyohensis ToBE]
MGLVNPRELLQDARRRGYALGAFNIHNVETIQAVVEAAQEVGTPVILQATPNTIKHLGIDFLVTLAQAAARKVSIPVALHLDHASEIDIIKECIGAGFTSVMFDGSLLPGELNLNLTRQVVEIAHSYGVAVEAELGRIGGEEEMRVREESFTDPDEAAHFVAVTKVDFLAIAIGTVHGVYRGEPRLDFARLKAIAQKVDIPLVLHGASGVPEEAIFQCIRLGISKINIATELKLAFTQALREALCSSPQESDPRQYMGLARQKVKELVKSKLQLFKLSTNIT